MDRICGGAGDHELEFAAGRSGQFVATLDRDLRVSCAELCELPRNGLADPGLQVVGGGCRRAGGGSGDYENANDRAVLTDLEFTDVRVAGEQGEVQGVDGHLTAAAGGKGEDVIVSTMDCFGADQYAPAWARVWVDGDHVGYLYPDQRLD